MAAKGIGYNPLRTKWTGTGTNNQWDIGDESESQLKGLRMRDVHNIPAARNFYQQNDKPVGVDTSYGVANEADVAQEPGTQNNGIIHNVRNFGQDILDKTMFGTVTAGFDATNPKAFNYNPALEGQIDYMKDLGDYGVMDSSGLNKITGGVLAGKNLQSMAGSNDLQAMYEKELERASGVLEGLPDQWSTLAASKDPYDIARYKKKINFHTAKVARIKEEQAKAAAAQQKDLVTRKAASRDKWEKDYANWKSPSGRDHINRAGIGSVESKKGPEGGSIGASRFLARGGRAGYQGGELVGQETDFIQGPYGDEEFQETVVEGQEEPSREELEALAIHIFQLPLEELNEEQLTVVYQAAMQEQPMEESVQEEDVQFAARGGRAGYRFGEEVEQQTDFLEGPQDDLMASGMGMESPEDLYRKAIQEGTFDGTFEEFLEELDRMRNKFTSVEGGLASIL